MTASTLANGMNGAAPAALPALPAAAPVWTEAPASVNVRAQLRGFDVMLTLRGDTGRDVLARLGAALDYLEAHGAAPTTARPGGALADAPACPTHGAPMRQGKRGGWYCPAKLADDGGDGRPVYCRQRVPENGGAS